MVEFQFGVNAVGGEAPYLAHHIKRVSGLVETALDVCFSFTDDAAKICEPVRIQEIFILDLDSSSFGVVQCHNFSPLAADVEIDLPCSLRDSKL